MELWPGHSYDEVAATKGKHVDYYDMGKRGFFSQVYGGDENTLVERLGIKLEIAKSASDGFKRRYKGVGREYERIFNDHCSMRQIGGIGSKVVWNEPKDYIESLTGFKRYFTLENTICKALFDLSNKIPTEWTKIPVTVQRRDRVQQVGNSIRSALLACAFQIQAQCMRAALNHKIQSTGAVLTKELQTELWQLQPPGCEEWKLLLLNVHDELMVPTIPALSSTIQNRVDAFVDRRSTLVPLLKMKWLKGLKTWSEK
jgi:DNA polymerase I-like protein with 3'-5' exonuclease and polymerase domains